MPIITISRKPHCGGAVLAKQLGKRLGYKVISREVIVEAAKKYGVSEEDLMNGMKSPPRLLGRLGKQQEQFILAVRATLAEMIVEDNIVYHGYAGNLLLGGLPKVIKLRLVAPLEPRVREVIRERKLTREEARKYIETLDAERDEWVRQLYKVDWADPSLYDLVLNLDQMGLDTVTELVGDLVNRKEYQGTPESEQGLRDFALTLRVKAALTFKSDFHEDSIEVKGRLGAVRLSGDRYFRKHKDAIVEFVRGIAGVTEVVTDIGDKDATPDAVTQLKASDVMIPINGYPHIKPWTTIREAMAALGTSTVKLGDGYLMRPRFILVLDELERLVGVIDRRVLLAGLTPKLETLERARGKVATRVPVYDLQRAMTFRWSNLFSSEAIHNSLEPVKNIMVPVRGTAKLDDDLTVVLTTMIHYRFDIVPVMAGDKVVGVVLMTEIFDTVANYVVEHKSTEAENQETS
jgi:cytidylate kinase/CBS domain-containing protein